MSDSEDPVYRLCFLELPGVLNFLSQDRSIDGQVTNDRPVFGGSAEKAFNLLVDIAWWKNSVNYTAIRSESIGGIANGTMTGCYRSMYENETDFTLVAMDYPVHDFKRLDPVQVWFEETAKIISIYHVDEKSSVIYSDILKSSLSSSFTINTWIIIFLAFIVLSLLLWLRGILVSRIKAVKKRMLAVRRGKRVKSKDPTPESLSQAVYQTFCHFIQQETRDFDDFLGSFLSIITTICFFFIITLYLNLMSTDLVVITKPKTIENYEDIMNSNPPVIPVFNKQFDDTKEFEKADVESVPGRFWEKYQHTHIAGDAYNDLQVVLQAMIDAFQETRVCIMAGLYADGMRKTVCSLKQSLLPKRSNSYSWMSQDPIAEKLQKGFIVRNGMKRTKFLKGLYLRVRRSFEAGFRDVMKKDFKEATMGFGMEADPRIVRECMSDVLKTNDFQVDSVVLLNFLSLFYLSLTTITLAFAQLFRELQYHTKTAQYLMTTITLIINHCFNR